MRRTPCTPSSRTGVGREGVGARLGSPKDTHICSTQRAGLEVGETPAWGCSSHIFSCIKAKGKIIIMIEVG